MKYYRQCCGRTKVKRSSSLEAVGGSVLGRRGLLLELLQHLGVRLGHLLQLLLSWGSLLLLGLLLLELLLRLLVGELLGLRLWMTLHLHGVLLLEMLLPVHGRLGLPIHLLLRLGLLYMAVHVVDDSSVCHCHRLGLLWCRLHDNRLLLVMRRLGLLLLRSYRTILLVRLRRIRHGEAVTLGGKLVSFGKDGLTEHSIVLVLQFLLGSHQVPLLAYVAGETGHILECVRVRVGKLHPSLLKVDEEGREGLLGRIWILSPLLLLTLFGLDAERLYLLLLLGLSEQLLSTVILSLDRDLFLVAGLILSCLLLVNIFVFLGGIVPHCADHLGDFGGRACRVILLNFNTMLVMEENVAGLGSFHLRDGLVQDLLALCCVLRIVDLFSLFAAIGNCRLQWLHLLSRLHLHHGVGTAGEHLGLLHHRILHLHLLHHRHILIHIHLGTVDRGSTGTIGYDTVRLLLLLWLAATHSWLHLHLRLHHHHWVHHHGLHLLLLLGHLVLLG